MYTAVLYALNGKQTSPSFNDHVEALRFPEFANRTSPARVKEIWATQSPAADVHSGVFNGGRDEPRGKFRFNLKAPNGEIIAASQGYERRRTPRKALRR